MLRSKVLKNAALQWYTAGISPSYKYPLFAIFAA